MFKLSKIQNLQKDVKVLLSNFFSLASLQVFGYIFPIITIPYVTSIIGVEYFGDIAFANAIIMYFKTLVDFGFNYTATRDVAINREDKRKVSEIFSAVIYARLILFLISFIILSVLIYFIPALAERSLLLWICFSSIFGYIMFPEWLFQAFEKMKYITILNLIAKTFFTVCIFVFIHEKEDYWIQPMLNSLGILLSGGFSLVLIFCTFKISLVRVSFSGILSVLKGSFNVFLNLFLPNLYNNLSVILLGFIGGGVSSGIYDAGSKFSNIAVQFLGIISRTFFPFLSRNLNKHAYFAKLSIISSSIVSIVLFFGAPYITRYFFTNEFYDAINVLRVLSLSIVAITITNVYGTNYLIIKNKEAILRNITMYCSLFGMMIVIPLVYYFSFIGAAIGIAITRLLLALFTYFYAVKLKT